MERSTAVQNSYPTTPYSQRTAWYTYRSITCNKAPEIQPSSMQQQCGFLFIFRNPFCHQIQIERAFPQLPANCKGVRIFLWIEGRKAGHIKKRNKRRGWRSLWTWSCTQSGSTVCHLPDKILGLSAQMTSKTSTTSQNELNPRRQCNNDARMAV